MAKRKAHEEHGANHERWMLTYADLITLLMIFFVVLYSMSQVDKIKFISVANALGVVMGDGPSIVNDNRGFNSVLPDGGLGKNTAGELDQTEQNLEEIIKEANLGDQVTIYMDERGIVISFNAVLLFKSGSADVNDKAKKILKNIAQKVNVLPNYVVVEGFTDDVPINTVRFPSNWELAAGRAVNVTKLFVSYGFNPEKISAKSYGEFRPGYTNDTAAHKRKNRRVDIVVMKIEHSKLEPHKTTP